MRFFAANYRMKQTIRMGGVPEHFFYPWKKWFRGGEYREQEGIRWHWTDYPGGSGAMIPDLVSGRLDLAFLLTESLAAGLAAGQPLRPLSVFVCSPLQWGIFTGAAGNVHAVSPVAMRRYAISRPGSGSELMARVDAGLRGENLGPSPWVVVGNLDGARKALASGEADLFFWERWTTQHLVNSGEFRRVDVRNSPWAGFVLAAGPGFEEKAAGSLKKIFREVCLLAAGIRQYGAGELASGYRMVIAEAEEWLETVEWAEDWTDPAPELAAAAPWFG